MEKPVQRVSRTFRSLTGMVLFVGAAAVLVSAGLTIWLTHLLTQQWVWDYRPPDNATDPEFGFPGAARTSLLVVAGLGGIVALVVAYRRQRHLEQDNAGQRDQIRLFTERFGAAADQLGSAAAATRLAGVYAMAALADEWVDQRQQCVDVLCAYLRLPYTPTGESDGALGRTLTTARQGSDWRAEVTDSYEFRHGEKQVRLTVISTIRDHLQAGHPTDWSSLDFDFSGATFDGGDFNEATFRGRAVFTGAEFRGGEVWFMAAVFAGPSADFSRSVFSGGRVNFGQTDFSCTDVSFYRARFCGGDVTFWAATFGGTVRFDGASFSAGEVLFVMTEFDGGELSFDRADFNGGNVLGMTSTFRRCKVHFGDAELISGGLILRDCRFESVSLSLWSIGIRGAILGFPLSTFSGGEASIHRLKLEGGTLDLSHISVEGGGRWDIRHSQLSGGQIDLEGSKFPPGSLDFGDSEFTGTVVNLPGGVTMDDLSSSAAPDARASDGADSDP